ncbi:MAG TPA: hypothetical protein VJ697_14235 [Nitrososphaeraceae archaeon]|nr:hypothetical protein [Nitrososphaeraceae archaeon]
MSDQMLDLTCCEPSNTFIESKNNLPIKVYVCIKCLNEWTTCHCRNLCKLIEGDSGSKYLVCSNNMCTFITLKCKKCNNLCIVERSIRVENPGRLFWICRSKMHTNNFFGGWIDCAVRKYIGLTNIYAPDYLCLMSEYTEYVQLKKIIIDVITRGKVTLQEIRNELLQKNFPVVENLIREISAPLSHRITPVREVVDLTNDVDKNSNQIITPIQRTPNRYETPNILEETHLTPKLNVTPNTITQSFSRSTFTPVRERDMVDFTGLNNNCSNQEMTSIQEIQNVTPNTTFNMQQSARPSIRTKDQFNEILDSIKSLHISFNELRDESNDLKVFIKEKLDKTEERTVNIEKRTDTLEERMNSIEEKANNSEETANNIEQRLRLLEFYFDKNKKRKTSAVNDNNNNNLYEGRLRKRRNMKK